jgi:hypothetical protein
MMFLGCDSGHIRVVLSARMNAIEQTTTIPYRTVRNEKSSKGELRGLSRFLESEGERWNTKSDFKLDVHEKNCLTAVGAGSISCSKAQL